MVSWVVVVAIVSTDHFLQIAADGAVAPGSVGPLLPHQQPVLRWHPSMAHATPTFWG